MDGVGVRAAELLVGDLLAGDGLDDVGAGYVHLAGALGHEDEVGDGGRVDGAARAGAHDDGDLRHDAGREGVEQEDVAVALQAGDALLDARAARVLDADDGGAHLHGEVHDLADLLRNDLRQGPAHDGEVLCEGEDLPAVDAAVAGHDSVAENLLVSEAELRRAVRGEAVQLLEGAGVDEQGQALAGGQLALLVLLRDAPLAAAREGSGRGVAVKLLKPGRLPSVPQAYARHVLKGVPSGKEPNYPSMAANAGARIAPCPHDTSREGEGFPYGDDPAASLDSRPRIGVRGRLCGTLRQAQGNRSGGLRPNCFRVRA